MTDAYASLADAVARRAGDPSPAFAAELRERVARALAPVPTPDPAVAEPVRSSMPQVITPYLCVHDGAAALDWYHDHFGARVSNVVPWEGRIGHAELDVAGAVFFLSDESPAVGVVSPLTHGPGASVSIVLDVAAVDEFVRRAEAGGAVVERPVSEAYGKRSAWLRDPFGYRWNVGTPLPTPERTRGRRRPAEPYYLTLTTPDVARAAAFYGAVLDWVLAPGDHGRHVTNTRMPMGLRPPVTPFSTTEPGEVTLWFTVRDFDDALDRVRVAGGSVVSVTAYDSGREAICTDDQGVEFRLSEPAPGYDVEP